VVVCHHQEAKLLRLVPRRKVSSLHGFAGFFFRCEIWAFFGKVSTLGRKFYEDPFF